MHWVRPELVAEIEYEGFTADGGCARHRSRALRQDKPAEEVEAETPAPAATELTEPTPAAPPRNSAATPRGSVSVMGVTISHADRRLWPDAHDNQPITKLDLPATTKPLATG